MTAPTAGRAVAWRSSAIALPYRDTTSARAGLRAEIAHEAAHSGAGTPDWGTMVLVGPVPLPSNDGQPWFDYILSVACRPDDVPRDRPREGGVTAAGR